MESVPAPIILTDGEYNRVYNTLQQDLGRARRLKCPRRNSRLDNLPREYYDPFQAYDVKDTATSSIITFFNDRKDSFIKNKGEDRFKEFFGLPQPHLVESYILPEKAVKYSFDPLHQRGREKFYLFRKYYGFGANPLSINNVLELCLRNLANPSEFLFRSSLKESGFFFEYCCRLLSATDPSKIFYLTHVWQFKFFQDDRGLLKTDPVASPVTFYLSKGNVAMRDFCERKQEAVLTGVSSLTDYTLDDPSRSQQLIAFQNDQKIEAATKQEWLLNGDNLKINENWTEFQPVLTDNLFKRLKLSSSLTTTRSEFFIAGIPNPDLSSS